MNTAPGPAPPGGPRRGVLLTLVAAVLATHLWLLAAPGRLGPVRESDTPAPKAPSRPLQTRLVLPPPTAAPQSTPLQADLPSPGGTARASARLLPASTVPAPPQTPGPIPEPGQDPDPALEPPLQAVADAAQNSLSAPALTPAATPAATPGESPDPDPPPVEAQAPPFALIDNTGGPADPSPGVPAPAVPGPAPAPTHSPTPDTPTLPQSASAALRVDPAYLPTPVLLSYDMRGQDRGLNYQASGELRWQHNDQHYALSLTVRALLLGSREWRSQGLVGPQGLQPLRFSDKRRTERATHFDHAEGRLVFSGNAPPVPLTAGAQDQVSLYVQLAAALASATPPLTAGSRVQVQTATTRDALPWLLTLERLESLSFEGRPLQTAYWVCLPRQRFDARIELWTSAEHQHLPARIRITQASGSFIDLQLRSQQSLPALPTSAAVGAKTTSP